MLGDGLLVDVSPWKNGRFITVGLPMFSLSIKDPDGRERVIASSQHIGRLSSAPDGSAVFEHELSQRRRVLAYYDPKQQNIRPLTRNGNEHDPLILPSGQQFAFIERADERMLRLCSIRSPDQCRTILQDPGLEALSGASPTGDRLAYTSRRLTNRLRLVSVADGLTTDFGPVTNDCRLRWPEQTHFWMFQTAADFTGWVHRRSDPATHGAQRTVRTTRHENLPPNNDPTTAPWRTERHESEVWLLTDRE